MNNLAQMLFEKNAENASRVVFVDNAETITYGQLEHRTRQLAAWLLGQGIQPGDRVNFVLLDKINTVAAFLAVTLIGAVAVMNNPRSRQDNLLYKIEFADAKLTLAESNLAIDSAFTVEQAAEASATLDPYTEYYPSELNGQAFMLWTSGTTGHAKAVMHTHRSFLRNVETNCASYPTLSTDRIMCTSKLFFAFGINYSFMTTMWVGAQALLESGLTVPSTVRESIRRYQPTKIYSVPFVYSQLVTDQQPIELTAKCFAAGDRLPPVLIDRWESLTGQRIYNMLGTSEVLNSILYNPRGTSSLGQATPGNRVRVVRTDGSVASTGETGYLEVQAPTIALGYYKDPEWTAKMFRTWVATGDVAYQDAAGDFYHQGRATDIIKIRGQYVNPGDIEESLQAYPGVSQSAVVSRLGINDIAIVEAYVVADSTVTPKDLRKWILSKHERYMCPKIFYLVQELPRTDTGKVQRYLLRKQQ